MKQRPTWMNWATQDEIAGLYVRGLSVRAEQTALNAERKRIRDRCYQRARRSREKEGVKP